MIKSLSSVLRGIEYIDVIGDANMMLKGVSMDSRKIEEGDLFVAVKGTQSDGHDFISKAIRNGASVVLCERSQILEHKDLTYVICKDSREILGRLAANYYDHPSKKLKIIGVTGTNGKTTVSTLLYGLFKEMGHKVGLISTIEIVIGNRKNDAMLTTPDILTLNAILTEMVRDGCEYVFMEVSSHAIHQRRISGLNFTGGIFTNISHDHLDYHGSFKAYIDIKKSFFDRMSADSIALINKDDKNGDVMVQNCKAKVAKYSLKNLGDFKGRIISMDRDGLYLEINGNKIMSRLTGEFNAYNLLAVYGMAVLMGLESDMHLLQILSNLRSAKGRFEVVASRPMVIIDYAHTPDALDNVLKTIKRTAVKAKIITVIGCGGDRDKAKRPLMGRIAARRSDQAIFTSDNPRSEDPLAIIRDMTLGLSSRQKDHVLEISDRKTAIKTAIQLAGNEDTILIAGKGHEEYQEIQGKKIYFSDHQIVKKILSEDI